MCLRLWNRVSVFCLLFLSCGLLHRPVAAQTWFNTYAYRRAITIDHTKIPNTDQVNFPILISGTYAYLATTANGGNLTNANGYDIIFTSDSTGVSQLPFEAESYNASTGAIAYWVQVPTVSHSTDTVIYMFYGNSSITTDQSNKTAVWDANYAGVWHLPNGSSLSASDSTANGNNGTITGATATTGEVGGGASFNGSYQNIDVGNASSLQIAGTSLTLEAWLNTSESSPSQYERILVKEVPGNAPPYMAYGFLRMAGATTLDFGISSGSVSGGVVTSSNLTLGAWTHLVGTYDGSNLKLYLNGALSNTSSQTGNILSTNQDVVFGEDTAAGAESYNGMLDEVRISNSVRSADWIAAEYNSESSPSTFYAVAAADTGGGTTSPVILSLTPSSGPTGISTTISGGNFGATQGTSRVTFNGITAAPTSWSSSSISVIVPSNASTGSVVVTVSGVASNTATYTVTSGPGIYSVSPFSGPAGAVVTINGENFGATQGTSTVSFNGTIATALNWTDTSLVVVVPNGSTSGSFTVNVNGQISNASPFAITALPTGWLETDIGSVGLTGNGSVSSGTFTLQGSGVGANGTADGLHFVYQPLSGDGTIVARVVSLQNGYAPQAGVMIRETLDPESVGAFTYLNSLSAYSLKFSYRSSFGANWQDSASNGLPGLPYWVKLVRSNNTFSGYISPDGVNWTQLGSSQTITMGQNAYIGLVTATLSNYNPALATGVFDNVSITSSTAPGPVITGLSSTTGAVGSQVGIAGSGFRSNWGLVTLNGAPVTINSWTNTTIVVTIPAGATSGPILVSVAPDMIESNYVNFSVTNQPLPTGWLDQDVGVTGVTGNSTFTNGALTVNGAGLGISVGGDQLHFTYQALSGDGSIVARIASVQGNVQAGLMIRETLDPNSIGVDAYYKYDSSMNFNYRTSSGGNWDAQGSIGIPGLPYWLKLVRAGDMFTAYTSTDGLYWTQLESSEALTMAQNVYIGLEVSSGSQTTLGSAIFDNVSINSAASVAPVVTGLSATTGPVGSQVVVTGYGFGASIGTSAVLLNDAPVTINSWSDTSIVATIPSGATSGFMVVALAPTMNASNPVVFTVTSQGLPISWLDTDIGAVNITGSATYASGTFTVQSSGSGIGGTSDAMHFVYQPLSGDGSITARVTGVQGGFFPEAGAMIRESLDPASTNGYMFNSSNYLEFSYRASSGGSTGSNGTLVIGGLPYWVRVVRAGSSFSAYYSSDGQNWTQRDSTQTISMAQNVYIGLGVSNISNSSLGTATFDNVSVAVGTTPFVTGTLPVLGEIGTSVTITGANFGPTQGSSSVTFNGVAASSITSWSDTQIVATVPTGATTGTVNVVVNSIQGISNANFSVITPVITGVSPPAAPIGGQITINGAGFGAYNGNGQVQFNGATVNNVYPWTDTSVTVMVPSGVSSGNLTLVEDGVSSNAVSFSVIEGLSVTGLSPTSGQVGSTVTVTGTGFGSTQSDSVVTVDGITASIVSWSDTSVTATVPTGASTGPVTVGVAGNTVDGPIFNVTSSILLTDSLGHQTTYSSVIAGGKWYISNAQGTGCSTCTIRGNIAYQYDASGNVLAATDPLGYTSSYTFDANSNVTTLSQPSVSGGVPTTYYTYNTFGEVLTMTDPLGHVTTNTYDAHGNLTSVTTPSPGGSAGASVTQFGYNSLGELTQITDPMNRVTTIAYTTPGYIYTITDPQSNVTTYGYDSHGNRTSITDALSHQTTFAYDSGDRLTTITYPDSSTTTFGYDYRGRRTSMTDQNGKTTTYTYDDSDRLTSVSDALNHTTQYAYDTESNLTSIEDANSHTTSFTYDALGRVTQTTFPSTMYETYGYDANNNLTGKTDRKSQTIQYVYDALNRLTQKTYPDSTSVEYTYDLVGKITQVTDPTGTYGFSYDNMGRLTGTSTQYSFLSGTFTNSYSYDANSNRTGYTAPDSSTNTYTYDTLNRLTNLTNSWAGSFGFSYDALSRRTQMTRPNGISTNYSYDNLSRLLSVLHQLSGSTIDGESYTVDSAGNRTAKTDHLASVTANYGYDSIYQLLSATQGGTTTESYTYDPVGNRLSSLGISSYTNNSSNELTADSNASFTYDYNGNTTSKTDSSGTTNYSWDYENRMMSVTLPGSGGAVTLKYDPFGRRIEKISPSTTSIFAYDGDNLIETVNATGGAVARYTQTDNVDEPLAMQRSGTTSFYEADGLGSITSLSNSSGALGQTYTYDSFGNTTNSSGSLTNFFRYTGREFDTETNLYYYRNRYYDPSTGRFLSEDPVRFRGGIDFYDYVYNNPLTMVDPLGLAPKVPWNRIRTRDCNALQLAQCAETCGAKGVQSCKVVQQFRITRVKDGRALWKWADGPMSCSCNDPEECPQGKPQGQPAPVPNAQPQGAPLLPVIIDIIEDILEGAAAAAAAG